MKLLKRKICLERGMEKRKKGVRGERKRGRGKTLNIPSMEIIGNKMKFKYEQLDWNNFQNETMAFKRDLFTNLADVEHSCGAFSQDFENLTCWMDSLNWSIMNKTSVTEDLYQFISHRAYIMRDSFVKEYENFGGWNWEAFIDSGTLNVIITCLESLGL